jgi:GNAT superfamily N-acetyltransferase
MYEVKLADGWVISDDRARLDLEVMHRYLAVESYWARGRSRAAVERSIAHSLCLGLYAADGSQGGFVRVISDHAVMAHLSDLFVLPAWRGRGLGKALFAAALAHPELASVGRWTLSTDDAHALYAPFGFGPHPRPETAMVRIVAQQPPESS